MTAISTTANIFSNTSTANLGGWVSINAPANGRGSGYVTSDDSYEVIYNVNSSVITEEETESNIDDDDYYMRNRTHYRFSLIPNYENKTDICPAAVLARHGETIVIWYSETSRMWLQMDDATSFLNEIGIVQ